MLEVLVPFFVRIFSGYFLSFVDDLFLPAISLDKNPYWLLVFNHKCLIWIINIYIYIYLYICIYIDGFSRCCNLIDVGVFQNPCIINYSPKRFKNDIQTNL